MLGFISENLIHVPVIAIGYFKIPIDFLLKILCLCKLFINKAYTMIACELSYRSFKMIKLYLYCVNCIFYHAIIKISKV